MKKIKNFFKNVKKEVSKVKWPSKKNMVKDSGTVIMFVIFFALFFAVLDILIALFKAMGA